MTYICAWHAPELAPDLFTSSRITEASMTPSPPPPYSSGISAASQPASVKAFTNASGYAARSSSDRQYVLSKPAHNSRMARRYSPNSAKRGLMSVRGTSETEVGQPRNSDEEVGREEERSQHQA